jgi:hypothetical protein
MPNYYGNTDQHPDNKYDHEKHIVQVMYDEIADGYICGYCLDDYTHSQLHATYGGNLLPLRLSRTRKTMKHLHDEDCLICGLSVARSFD